VPLGAQRVGDVLEAVSRVGGELGGFILRCMWSMVLSGGGHCGVGRGRDENLGGGGVGVLTWRATGDRGVVARGMKMACAPE